MISLIFKCLSRKFVALFNEFSIIHARINGGFSGEKVECMNDKVPIGTFCPFFFNQWKEHTNTCTHKHTNKKKLFWNC